MEKMIKALKKHNIEFWVEDETAYKYGCITVFTMKNGRQIEKDYYFENGKLIDVTTTV